MRFVVGFICMAVMVDTLLFAVFSLGVLFTNLPNSRLLQESRLVKRNPEWETRILALISIAIALPSIAIIVSMWHLQGKYGMQIDWAHRQRCILPGGCRMTSDVFLGLVVGGPVLGIALMFAAAFFTRAWDSISDTLRGGRNGSRKRRKKGALKGRRKR